MKNYIQPGDTLTVSAPGATESGAFVAVGAIYGFAVTSAAVGEDVAVKTAGVFETTVATPAGVLVGDVIFYDGVGLTTAADDAGDPLVAYARVGVAVTSAAPDPDALIDIKLD